jgi:hypothetical protein
MNTPSEADLEQLGKTPSDPDHSRVDQRLI